MSFRIRDEQAKQLAQACRQGFEDRAVRHLLKFFPRQMSDLSEAERRAYLATCVQQAGRYGLTSEQAVMCFAHLPFLLGADFETSRRWGVLRYGLRNPDVPPTDRAKIVLALAYQMKARGW
jgi:hypothetical protein